MTKPMTDHMARVLDGFTGSERRGIWRVAAEVDDSTVMGRIVRAVRTELRARQLVEDELMLDLEQSRLAELDVLDAAHPYPVPDPSMRFTVNPETGEIVRDEGVNPDEGKTP